MHLNAPKLFPTIPTARNATLQWKWQNQMEYSSFPMQCHVEVNKHNQTIHVSQLGHIWRKSKWTHFTSPWMFSCSYRTQVASAVHTRILGSLIICNSTSYLTLWCCPVIPITVRAVCFNLCNVLQKWTISIQNYGQDKKGAKFIKNMFVFFLC